METKPITNADRIRAMTDEQMAEKASMMAFCSACPVLGCECLLNLYECKDAWLAWLRSPAESEEEE